jgi:hypothetical protein
MAKTVKLTWTESRQWVVNVPVGMGQVEENHFIARAMEEAVNASGVFQSGRADPESIRFEVEDK